VLRRLLEDPSPTSTIIAISGSQLSWNDPNNSTSSSLPEILKDASKRKEKAELRRCDKAAEILSDLVLGFPEYYALLNDAEDRILAMRNLLDRYGARLKRLTGDERERLASWARYAPMLPPLGHPATAADVEAGKVIFHLDGNGKKASIKLPAVGTWKKAAKDDELCRGLIVQAEVRPDGSVVYGVVNRHAMQMVAASEFAEVVPLGMVERKSNGVPDR
jgi:hypothetical protein